MATVYNDPLFSLSITVTKGDASKSTKTISAVDLRFDDEDQDASGYDANAVEAFANDYADLTGYIIESVKRTAQQNLELE